MKKLIFVISLILSVFALTANTQEVQFRASAKNVVRTGERFKIVYTLNAEGIDFRGPGLDDFRVLSGPNISQSSGIQIINGKVSRSVEYTFSYILTATKDGIFTVPPARVNIDGKTFESNSLKIQVVRGSSPQQSQQGKTTQPGGTDTGENDVFIKVVVDKKNPLQGEQVIVTYKLYYCI
ncbi:MAG: BatD family protein, partial [Bacteroidetes bacterium]|nr:BatD family protein [Bacteroidota bacterium]